MIDFNLIFEFLKTHYRDIIDVSALLFSVVILIIRKRPVYNEIDAIKKDGLDYLPVLISMVERSGNGAEKKQAVLDLLSAYLRKKFHFEINDELLVFFGDAIESILTTPQKKKGV